MPDSNPSPTPAQQDRNADGNILCWLTDGDAQRPWSVDEIVREYGDHADAVDALARLYGTGLIHRLGEYVWATRAAIHADAITI
jgi:hypothetical protein